MAWLLNEKSHRRDERINEREIESFSLLWEDFSQKISFYGIFSVIHGLMGMEWMNVTGDSFNTVLLLFAQVRKNRRIFFLHLKKNGIQNNVTSINSQIEGILIN